MASVAGPTEQPPAAHGHSFGKKTFHKPTYCHHCGDMLWGLIQQGFICEGEMIHIRTLPIDQSALCSRCRFPK